jgi:hypothetical protein
MRREREAVPALPHMPSWRAQGHNFNIYVLQQGMKYVIAILKLVGSGLFICVRVLVAHAPTPSSVCRRLQLVNKMFLFVTK